MPYSQVLSYYQNTASKNQNCKLLEYGATDCGKPLQLFVISKDKDFDPVSLKKKNKLIILINNGIHAGEPDGVDASIEFVQQILDKKFTLPEGIVIAIIPVYNIDGALNRGCCTRANQDGPEEYGFRANARYLDLNRDFIKMDSRNAEAFAKLYHAWDPDIFIDTHVSNGADYQSTMTLIVSQLNKLSPDVSKVMRNNLVPELYARMKQQGEAMTPYVNVWGTIPDNGYDGFDDSPRYASGYSSLFHAFPFVTETHMLKPYARRVESTITFLKTITTISGEQKSLILEARKKAQEAVKTSQQFTLSWKLDSLKADSLEFRGYKAVYPVSKVTSLPQLHYDRSQPFTKTIPYYNTFNESVTVNRPKAYIIPQAWKEVIHKMELNGVQMQRLLKDTTLTVELYHIDDYQTKSRPYEGHYLHSGVKVSKLRREKKYQAGDYLIFANQSCNRYIIETLEPQAPDSWFAWGFFDAVLQYKEGISDYVWEPQAEKILNQNPALKKEFELRKQQDSTFASNPYEMLNWIYLRSEWAEPDAFLYPVGRVEF